MKKLLKAVGVGGAVCLITVIAPLAPVAVATLTVTSAAISWAVDSLGDKTKKS